MLAGGIVWSNKGWMPRGPLVGVKPVWQKQLTFQIEHMGYPDRACNFFPREEIAGPKTPPSTAGLPGWGCAKLLVPSGDPEQGLKQGPCEGKG